MSRQTKQLRLWTLDKVKNALPLLRAILLDMRERCLEGNAILLQTKRLKEKPGIPTRNDMVLLQNLDYENSANDTALKGNMEELLALGAFCSDPICAVSLMPFHAPHSNGIVHSPAWFVYSPFGNELYWRLDRDPETMRRNVKDLDSHVEIK